MEGKSASAEDSSSMSESSVTGSDLLLVWKLVAKSRFLTSPETGRLLFSTNKTFVDIAKERNGNPHHPAVDETDDDSTWKLLSANHWGVEKTNELIRIMGPTAKGCFRSLAYPLDWPYRPYATAPRIIPL